ncbi:hypothetical protein Btru_076128 [Bulinus truncatus]|nr:hypothetical protein Btru_076128 [Bulinus truncatus]
MRPVLSEDVVIQEVVPEDVAILEVVPEDVVILEVVPEDVVIQEVVPEDAIIHEVVPEDVVIQEVVPEDVVILEVVPEDVVIQEVIPEDAIIHEVVPEDVVIQEVVPENVVIQEVVPEDVVIHEVVPEDVVIHEVAPDDVVIHDVIPDDVGNMPCSNNNRREYNDCCGYPNEGPEPNEGPAPNEVLAPNEVPTPKEGPAPNEGPSTNEGPSSNEGPATNEGPEPNEGPATNEGKLNIVDSDTVYIVTPDAQPGTETQTSLVSCELVFRASQEEGHLCVIQDDSWNTVSDPNVEIIVKDGHGDDEKEIFTLKYMPSPWQHREHCTESQYVTIHLSRINNNIPVAMSKLNINIKIVNIKSKLRKIYMDETYCDDTFNLENSVVTVFNRAPYSDREYSKVKSHCGVKIKKKSGENSRICLVYAPSKSSDLQSEWSFKVTKKDYDSNPENILYELKWNDPRTKSIHSWCASNETVDVMLIFIRNNTNVTTEPPEAIRYILSDFNGPESDLLKLVSEESVDGQSQATVNYVLIIIVTVCSILLVLVVLLVMLKKKAFQKLCHGQYEMAHNPENKC